MGLTSGCGGIYRTRLSHRTVPHPTIATAPTLRAVFRLALRQTEGLP